MPLTDTKVKNARPAEKSVKLTDGFGLYLLVHPNGSKYWQLGYRFEGKQKVFSIGVYPAVSLADARQRRNEAKKLLAAGIDPSAKKQADNKIVQEKRNNTRAFKLSPETGLPPKPPGQKIISALYGHVLKRTCSLISATTILENWILAICWFQLKRLKPSATLKSPCG